VRQNRRLLTPAPAPPWSQVIATTIRLWWQRRFGAPAVGRRRTLSRFVVSGLVIALVAAIGTAIYLAEASPSVRLDGRTQSASAPGAVRAAAASRKSAASWIAAQVGQRKILGRDTERAADRASR